MEGREIPFGDSAPVDMVVGPGESDNKRFGELLERLRWKAGLSRADAAAKLGLSGEYLRLIEGGKRTPALGQMQNFLTVYGAEGGVELDPHGQRQDLIIFDPINDDRDPTFVEFKSRIREARRRALGGPPDEDDDLDTAVDDLPSDRRVAELGLVVTLLTRADDRVLRKVRKLLEDHVV